MAALLLLVVPAVAAVDLTARQWIERLVSADSQVAYRGLVVYERGDHTESLRVTHGVIDGRRYDHLEHLDGEQREVIRTGSSLICVYPGQRLTRLLRDHQRAEPGGVEDHYSLQLDGESRVAGRPVVLLEVTPRDRFRLGYRFALDRETGLILRYEQVDAGQRVLERFQFASLDVSESMPATWRLAAISAPAKPVSPNGGALPLPAQWQPLWLPPGFTEVTGADERGGAQTFSDGMAMLSIFVEGAEIAARNSGGNAQRGATAASTAQLLHGEQAFVVTVIGEVPPLTAQRVADAVGWREGASS